MEKRSNSTKPLALHAMAAGIIVGGSVLVFAALESTVRVLGRGLGTMIGQAVGSVLRALFSVGGSLPQPPGPDSRLPSLIGRLREASLTGTSGIVAAGVLTNRIATIAKTIKKRRARSARAK